MENKKGFVPIVLAVAALVVGVAVGGYFVLNKNIKTPSLKSVKLSDVKLPGVLNLNPNCKYKDADLCKYMNRYASMEQFNSGFSGKSVTTDKTGKKNESMWEMEGEGKTHFVTYDGGKEILNTIVIGDTTYTKDMQDNKWWKYVASKEKGNVNSNFFKPEEFKEKFKDTLKDAQDKTTYKKIGKEACGSLTCFKYQVINPDFTDSTEYLYFDDREYLMRKMSVEGSGMVTVTTFDYNKVSIKVPSPIKEGEPGFNTFFNLPTSEEEVPKADEIDTAKLQEEMKKILDSQMSSESSE